MMLDADVVAVSPSSVYRVLKAAGRIERFNGKPSRKGGGFQQPLLPHEHWHVDISYLNIGGTFYYLCSHPGRMQPLHRPLGNPRVDDRGAESKSSCNGRGRSSPRPSADHLRQRPAVHRQGLQGVHPPRRHDPCADFTLLSASNGKIERWHQTLKSECIRPGVPLSIEDACRLVGRYVEHYNGVRLHSAIGYVAPLAKLEGREAQIFAERDRKLEAARRQRQQRRQEAFVPLADRVGDSPTAALN